MPVKAGGPVIMPHRVVSFPR